MGSAVIKCAGEFSISRATFSQPYIPPLPNRTLSLLLHMDGANNSTTFRDDSLNYLGITANGNAQISTAQYKFGGASGLFDRDDTTYVGGASNSNFAFESDFTIEMWVYMIQNNIGYQAFLSTHTDGLDATGWVFLLESNGNMYFYGSDGTQSGPISGWNCQIATETYPDSEQWVHIAVVRYNNVITIYKDGVDVTSARYGTQTVSISSAQNFEIGHYTSLPEGNKTPHCYIDELRIVKGYAAYTSNFTPANQPFPNPQISILLHMDGSNESTNFVDSSLNNLTVTPAEPAQISTAQYKFGGASGYFIRQDDSYLQIENIEEFEFGANDFTLECWVYPIEENGNGGGTCIARWGGSNNAFFFQANTTGGIEAYLDNTFIEEASGGTILPNTWSHICLTRSNGQVRGFINGELIGTAQFPNFIQTGGTELRIGGDVYGNTKFNGYIDEVRIINNFAAYTGNFTPSNQPFPNP